MRRVLLPVLVVAAASVLACGSDAPRPTSVTPPTPARVAATPAPRPAPEPEPLEQSPVTDLAPLVARAPGGAAAAGRPIAPVPPVRYLWRVPQAERVRALQTVARRVVVGEERRVRVLDPGDGSVARELALDGSARNVSPFHVVGDELLVSTTSELQVVDSRGGDPRRTFPCRPDNHGHVCGANALALGPDDFLLDLSGGVPGHEVPFQMARAAPDETDGWRARSRVRGRDVELHADSERVYVASRLLVVHALDDGRELWRRERETFGQWTGVAVSEERVMHYDRGPSLAIRNAAEGGLLLRVDLGEAHVIDVALDGAHVFLALRHDAGGSIARMAIATGEVVWRTPLGGWPERVELVDGSLFVRTRPSTLYELDASDGAVRGRWREPAHDFVAVDVAGGSGPRLVLYDRNARELAAFDPTQHRSDGTSAHVSGTLRLLIDGRSRSAAGFFVWVDDVLVHTDEQGHFGVNVPLRGQVRIRPVTLGRRDFACNPTPSTDHDPSVHITVTLQGGGCEYD